MQLISSLRLTLDPTHADIVALVGAGGKTTTLFRLAEEIVAGGHRAVTTTTTRIFAAQMAYAPAHLHVEGDQIDWGQLEQKLARHGHCLLVTTFDGPKAVGVSPAVVDELARRAADLGIAAVIAEADGSRHLPLKAPAAHEPVIPDSTTLLVPMLGLTAVGLKANDERIHRATQVQALLGIDASARLTPAHLARLLIHKLGGAKGKPEAARLLPLLNQADGAPRLAAGRLIARLLADGGYASLIGAVGEADQSPIRERWGATAAVVLAAGGSRRMREAKQLLEMDGEPLVVRAARRALTGDATDVIVVSGAYGNEVCAALEPLVVQSGGRLRLVHNPAWESGQATSIHAAMAALRPECVAVQFLPVDQPFIPTALLRNLWQRWRDGADLVAPSVEGELRGAPAIFDLSHFPALRELSGDQGARPILKQNSAEVATVATSALWLADADTPEEWAQMRKMPPA